MVAIGTMRTAAVLIPAALAVHQLAYWLLGGGGAAAHGYLEALMPIAVAAAVALAAASLVAPLLRSAPRGAHPLVAPLALGAALVGIFLAQELAEALLGGTGAAGFGAALAAGWVVLPLSLLLGIAAAVGLEWLARAGEAVLSLLGGAGAPPSAWPPIPAVRSSSVRAERPLSPLQFGLARRPPPALV